MAWPRSIYHFASLRSISLWEATLPVSTVRMLGDCPAVEHVELRDCRVRVAVDYAMSTPAQRCRAFLEQFLEPLSRYRTVVVQHPHVVLVDVMVLPPDNDVPPAWGSLALDVGTDEGLGALLHWAGKRGKLGFSAVTVVFHHVNAESLLTHHGLVHPLPTVFHPSFYRAARLPVPASARQLLVGKLKCSELVLVDAVAFLGHVGQRRTATSYDVDVSDDCMRQAVANAMRKAWSQARILLISVREGYVTDTVHARTRLHPPRPHARRHRRQVD